MPPPTLMANANPRAGLGVQHPTGEATVHCDDEHALAVSRSSGKRCASPFPRSPARGLEEHPPGGKTCQWAHDRVDDTPEDEDDCAGHVQTVQQAAPSFNEGWPRSHERLYPVLCSTDNDHGLARRSIIAR